MFWKKKKEKPVSEEKAKNFLDQDINYFANKNSSFDLKKDSMLLKIYEEDELTYEYFTFKKVLNIIYDAKQSKLGVSFLREGEDRGVHNMYFVPKSVGTIFGMSRDKDIYLLSKEKVKSLFQHLLDYTSHETSFITLHGEME